MTDSTNWNKELRVLSKEDGNHPDYKDDFDYTPKEGEDVLARARRYAKWVTDKQELKKEMKVLTYQLKNGTYYKVRRYVYSTKLDESRAEFASYFDRINWGRPELVHVEDIEDVTFKSATPRWKAPVVLDE